MELHDIKKQIDFHKKAIEHYENLYKMTLHDEEVLLDPEKRKAKIIEQIENLGKEIKVEQILKNLDLVATQKNRRAICNYLRLMGYKNKVVRRFASVYRVWVKSNA